MTEFMIDGLIVIGIWTVLAVAGAVCWGMWERYVRPTPKPNAKR